MHRHSTNSNKRKTINKKAIRMDGLFLCLLYFLFTLYIWNMLRGLIYLLMLQFSVGEYCYGQNSSNDSLFKNFRQDVQIQIEGRGFARWDDETRQSYYLLMSACPVETLVKFADDSIPGVRAQIFFALAQKNLSDNGLLEILNKHKEDTAKFVFGSTDNMISWTVRDFMQMVLDFKAE